MSWNLRSGRPPPINCRIFDDFVNDVAMVSADFGDELEPTERETPAD
nr:MAG TPA: hypothetical protein [Caudoviricetes sp.]